MNKIYEVLKQLGWSEELIRAFIIQDDITSIITDEYTLRNEYFNCFFEYCV